MEIIRFALLGLATGALYALLSQGLVLVYRGSGLLNFAQGAMAMLGAFAYYELAVRQGLPLVVALIAALVITAVAGALIHLLVMQPMRTASALSRVIATLGLVLVLQSAAFLRYGHDPLQVPSVLPTRPIDIVSSQLSIGLDRVVIFGIAVAISVVLYLVYRYTRFGAATTAVAENTVAAAALGHSPNLIAMVNWAIGSALAGLAGVLIAPIIFLEPTGLVLLIIPAMAAALLGEFVSFPIAFVAALVLGIAQSEIQRYVSQPGWATGAPFVVVVIVMAVRGRSLPLRSFVLDRLPKVGTGRVRIVPAAVAAGLLCAVAVVADADWATALVTTMATAIICLSVVVLSGYAGQLSLAQFVLAGVGALVAARAVSHVPFIVALLIGAGVTALVGAIVGLPAVRARGVTLAVATLALAGALSAVVLLNPKYTGGVGGLLVPTPELFGWDLDPGFEPNNYALFCAVVLVLLSLMVANLRRGAVGKRLLAVRSNERAAASLGINVSSVKTYAFSVASGIAGVGGILLAFLQPAITVASFDVFSCILVVAVTVTGGVGNIAGAYLGSTMIAGGLVSQLFTDWDAAGDYLPLIGGVLLVLTLVTAPNGLVEANRTAFVRLAAPLLRKLPASTHRSVLMTSGTRVARVEPKALSVRGVSVSFGGVHAVREVSIDVAPGEVHGLIGPNGAGKTTLIDVVTGFARARQGQVLVGDTDVTRWAARRRARCGLSRSFQSLELFSDLTVGENLAVAAESVAWWRYVTDLVFTRRTRLNTAASEVLRQFELTDLIDVYPSEVSFGQRKTVAIARAIATSPSILLLDEPAAGLDDHEVDELSELIRRLAHEWGIAVLLVEHKVSMIMSISDRVTVMQAGSVLASGTPDEAKSNQAVIDAYLGSAASQPAQEEMVS